TSPRAIPLDSLAPPVGERRHVPLWAACSSSAQRLTSELANRESSENGAFTRRSFGERERVGDILDGGKDLREGLPTARVLETGMAKGRGGSSAGSSPRRSAAITVPPGGSPGTP